MRWLIFAQRLFALSSSRRRFFSFCSYSFRVRLRMMSSASSMCDRWSGSILSPLPRRRRCSLFIGGGDGLLDLFVVVATNHLDRIDQSAAGVAVLLVLHSVRNRPLGELARDGFDFRDKPLAAPRSG